MRLVMFNMLSDLTEIYLNPEHVISVEPIYEPREGVKISTSFEALEVVGSMDSAYRALVGKRESPE
jgi:hypothetical protein